MLHELALYGPGAAALRSHKRTMDALRVLAESGTKESRERAAGALFELDEEARAAKPTQASDAEPGASKPPPLSYFLVKIPVMYRAVMRGIYDIVSEVLRYERFHFVSKLLSFRRERPVHQATFPEGRQRSAIR